MEVSFNKGSGKTSGWDMPQRRKGVKSYFLCVFAPSWQITYDRRFKFRCHYFASAIFAASGGGTGPGTLLLIAGSDIK
jgi:hypothetical protein